MIKNKLGYKTAVVVSIVAWFIFVWMHTFTFLTCYEESTGIYRFFWIAIFTMIATLFYWFYLKPDNESSIFWSLFEEDFDDLDDLYGDIDDELQKEKINEVNHDVKKWSTLRKSMFFVGGLAFIYLLAFALEMWTDITIFTDSKYINIGFLVINKKYMFDPILFIIVPIWTQVIFRGMREEKYIWKSVVSGCVQILMITLMSYLLFMKLPNVWLIELAIIETIEVIASVIKYSWKTVKRKGNVIALIGIYVVFWCVLLAIFHYPGQTITQYTYGNDWVAYKENVSELLAGASAFGSSPVLAHNPLVHEFLTDRNNYLLVALYYRGSVAAGFVVILLILFLITTRRMLGKHAKYNWNYLVYNAAWWSLAVRVIMGIPYSFGLLAIPISLPFAGKIGIYMDTIALGLLVWSVIEGRQIDASIYKDCRVRDLFEYDDVEISEIEYDEDWGLLDLVQVRSGETVYECVAKEATKFNALVLKSIDKRDNWLLILKKDDETGKWSDVDDDESRKSVRYEFMVNNCPYCMEVIEE